MRKRPLKPVCLSAATTSLRMPRHVLLTSVNDTVPRSQLALPEDHMLSVALVVLGAFTVKLLTNVDHFVGIWDCSSMAWMARPAASASCTCITVAAVPLLITSRREYKDPCRSTTADPKLFSESNPSILPD